ncbi:hypothetical protein K2P97_09505 [bacterium]|nr:hypothetical protein [bacterium]
MKSILMGLSLISSMALAETATITVNGMHCSGCKEMVKAKVCGDETIKANAESCEVKLVDESKEIGQVTIVSKPETKVDVAAVEAGIKAAGEEYKVAKVDVTENIVKIAEAGKPAKVVKTKKVVKKATETKKETK